MKHLWQCNMAHLHDLVVWDSTISSSVNGVNCNNDYEHKDDVVIPSLLVFEPQEFARPPSNAISIFFSDDTAKAGCGQ